MITSTFMYFESANGNGSVYVYDKESGKISECDLEEVSFYTQDFESLYFSKDGFAIFNGTTEYFYNKYEETGDLEMYRRATAEDNANDVNEYGFINETFDISREMLTYEGKNYLRCDGAMLNFFREEATKNYYPVPIDIDESKHALERLSFQPTGKPEFSVIGTVKIGGLPVGMDMLNCLVVREKVEKNYEMYILIEAGVGYYRFDLEAKYVSNEYNSKDNAYEITKMTWVVSTYAYSYLDTYYKYFMSDYEYGTSLTDGYKNNVGYLELHHVYNTDGQKDDTQHYLVGEFFEGTKMYDVNGNLISFDTATLTSSEDTKKHEATFVGEDGYTYHMYFELKYHPAFQTWGYKMTAFTREERLETTDGYTIIVERRMFAEDASFIIGTQYKVTVEKDGVIKEISELTERMSVGEFYNLQYYYIDRINQGDGTEKIIFYSVKFTKPEVVDPNEKLPAPYTSAEYFEIEAKVYYTQDGSSKITYVEGLGIPFVEYKGGFDFIYDVGAYDAETGIYTCQGARNTYYIKIVGDYVEIETKYGNEDEE